MSEINPSETLLFLSTVYWASRCLHVAAELGVADFLDSEPQTAAQLAANIGVNAKPLHRILRALVNRGVFELKGGRFSHNAASRLLRTDVDGSMRLRAMMDGLPMHWDAYRELGSTLRTGRPAIEGVVKGSLFGYLGAHRDEARVFAGAMVGKSSAQISHVLAACDFRRFKTIGDIGGGLGHLLEAVLETAPATKGVVFDLPEVIDQARPSAHSRITYVGGSFFEDRIPPCDAYMLMNVLHDWSDEESVAILKNIQSAAPASATFLIIEGIVDEESRGDFLIDCDIEMMVMTTGRERTRVEWEAVFQAAGLPLKRILQAGTWTAVIEAGAA